MAAQTRQPDEVFLWDDCSPKDPTNVARLYSSRFSRFVFHRNECNLGMPGNLNAVVGQATGDFVANLHDADQYHPTLLEKWEAALLRYPSAGLVFCGLDCTSSPGGIIWIHDFPPCTSGREFFHRVYAGSAGSPIWGTVMVRREAYQRHLPFDPQFRNWANVDMWMRFCGTHDIAYVPESLITLDATPTQVRSFTWDKFLIIHRMPIVNIFRLARSAAERDKWLDRQKCITRRYYWRHLVGRARHREWANLWAGMALAPVVYGRLFDDKYLLPAPNR